MKKINIKINNKKIICLEGDTLMKVARINGIHIPGLCGHPDFRPKGNCRLCLVEEKGNKNLVLACHAKVKDGMEIFTDTPRIEKTRNMNIELIFAEHIEKCPTCILRYDCPLLSYARKYGISITRFKDRKGKRKIYKFSNAVEIDGTQCIDCRNCIDACSLMQKIDYLEIKGKAADQEIVPTKNKKIDCIYCGQCTVHCPVTAAQEQTSWEVVEKIIRQPAENRKIVVAQIAPSIRVSIGETFGLEPGKIMLEQMVAGLKKIGFDYVFDVNFGADLTTIVEAEELLERIKNKGKMPLITSCCPAWVKYAEFYYPELIMNITTSRSPQIHAGGVTKTYWAEKMKINPKDIVVVSIMPCTAKKFESRREELKINGMYPIDYVLTTREFSWMLKKNNIDLGKIKGEKIDGPLGIYSGAAAIYGASGGVMESALRTAEFLICGNNKNKLCNTRIDFKEVRGMEGVKESVINLVGKKIRVAVVNGIGNIEPVINNLNKYDYIEVMACPGGCIGGGGQPIPTNAYVRQKRMEALYKLDKSKDIRKAHENKNVLEVYKWIKEKKLAHKILHTKYKKRII